MTVRVGINGFGRIGRNFFRAVQASGADIEVVAANDLGDLATMAHLLKYDSILGRYPAEVSVVDGGIQVGDRLLKIFAEREPGRPALGRRRRRRRRGVHRLLHRREQGEGAPRRRGEEGHHLRAGVATRTSPSSWASTTTTTTRRAHTVISNASCTTNCLGPMAKALHDEFGIVKGLMTTIHAYTQDQNLQDAPHKDLRRARAAALNLVPTSTGAAKAIGLVLPELKGKLDGYAVRVPIPTGSATDLTVELGREATAEEVNAAVKAAADGPMKGFLRYSTDPIVSSDIVTDPASCIFDAPLTKVIGNQAKVVGWYDNEWGYSNRLVDLITLVGKSL